MNLVVCQVKEKPAKRKPEPAETVAKKKAKVDDAMDTTNDTTLGDLEDTNNFAEEEDSGSEEESEDEESGDEEAVS